MAVDFVKKHLEKQDVKEADAVSSSTLNISSIPEADTKGNSNVLVAYFSTNDTIR